MGLVLVNVFARRLSGFEKICYAVSNLSPTLSRLARDFVDYAERSVFLKRKMVG